MKEYTLTPKSSRKDVASYIKKFNSEAIFNQDTILSLLDNLVQLEIDTYTFSIGANTAAQTIDKAIVSELETYMNIFDATNPKSDSLYDTAFVAYYLLTYYYRIYEKMDKLSSAISKYHSYFEEKAERYALSYQIKGRYLRRRGNGQEALVYDRLASELLKKKNIENIQVEITNASTVSLALENRETYITEQDINASIAAVQKAIVVNSDYPKYRYLCAKLIMFSLLFKNSNGTLDEIDYASEIKNAKELLRSAIELEDPHKDSYSTSISEYKTYLRAADLVLAEIRLTEFIKKEQKAQITSVDSRIGQLELKNERIINASNMSMLQQIADLKVSAENQISSSKTELNTQINNSKTELNTEISRLKSSLDTQLKETQDKYLEILGVVVSIVSVLMVIIGTYSAKLSITAILVATFAMCVGVIGVYSAFLILLREKTGKKYVVFLVISIVLETILIVLSIMWPTIRTILEQIFTT